MNISKDSNALELDLARGIADKFRVNKTRSESIIEKITGSVSYWHEEAKKINIPRSEILQMESAFHVK